MKMIEIVLLDDVSFSDGIDRSIGFEYDVPFDDLNIPYIPINSLLKTQGVELDGVQFGFPKPDGYFGMVKAFHFMTSKYVDAGLLVRNYFTNSRFIEEKGYNIRSLKAGLRFIGRIEIPEGRQKEVEQILKGIERIGICQDGISGRVRVRLIDHEITKDRQELYELCKYSSLDYSIMLLTPACIPAPYEPGLKTYCYLPGALMRDLMSKSMDVSGMTFANAYIGADSRRLLPVPTCGALVKLDKSQYRYRLSSGKDYKIVEQDSALKGSYCVDPTQHCLIHTSPDVKRITSNDGRLHDALVPGQIFCGSIYGSDEQIRCAHEILMKNPLAAVGNLKDEGCGECFVMVDHVKEAQIPSASYANEFDLVCLSNTILMNEEGMSSSSPSDLLSEIEYHLGISGKLMIKGMYTDIANDYSMDYSWGQERESIRCISAGSSIRIKTRDDSFIDISPLQNAFLGERTEEGYGEMKVYPAKEQYYRVAKKVAPQHYSLNVPLSYRTSQIGMNALASVITDMLKRRVEGMAYIDRMEYKRGISVEELMPKEVLSYMKEQFNPFLSDSVLEEWYRNELEGHGDV